MALDEPLTAEQQADIDEELDGRLFRLSAWFAAYAAERHSECHVCWDRIDDASGAAYVTADHEVAWVCPACFVAEQGRFRWHVVST